MLTPASNSHLVLPCKLLKVKRMLQCIIHSVTTNTKLILIMLTINSLKSVLFTVLGLSLLMRLSSCQEVPDDECPACPKITSINPNHGRGGDIVVITGANFEGFIPEIDQVTFNGKEAAVVETPTETKLEVQVPENSGSGPVMVTIGELSSELTDRTNFIYDFVKIDEIVPTHGRAGDIITINGAFFSTVPIENEVQLADKKAEVVAASEDQLQIVVPQNAGIGVVKVTINSITTEGPLFTYDYVEVESIEPATAKKDEVITVNGKFFSSFVEQNSIVFDGGLDGEITEVGETTLKVKVPKGAGTGPLTITVDGHTVEGPVFTYEYTKIVTTLAGTGVKGFADGPGSQAQFNLPMGIVTDEQGNVYVADRLNNRIRKINPNGQVSTVAGDSQAGNSDGTLPEGRLNAPWGIAYQPDGNIYISDTHNNLVRKVVSRTLTTIAGVNDGQRGKNDGPVSEARFFFPTGVAVDADGAIIVADAFNRLIRKVKDGQVTTVANGVDILGFPRQLVIDKDGNIYHSDDNVIHKITSTGQITVFAGTGNPGHVNGPVQTAEFNSPAGMVIDKDGNIYVCDESSHRIRKISAEGIVSDFAGSGDLGFVDGEGDVARFNEPYGLAMDKDGNFYVADSENNVIRKIILE